MSTKTTQEIEWSYRIYPGGRKRTKRGVYIGKITHRKGYTGEQMAFVHFYGNSRQSKVKFSEITFL